MSDDNTTLAPAPVPEPKPGEAQPNATGGGQQPTAIPEKTFFQADVDRIIGERLARDRDRLKKEVEQAFLSQFGVESPNEIAELLKAQREAEEEKLSELQRLEQAKEDYAQKLAQSQAQLAEASAQLQLERTHRRVERRAYLLDFNDPADAVNLLDLSALTGDGDEGLTTEGIKTALEALAKQKPYLVKSTKPIPPKMDEGAGGGRKGKGKEEDAEAQARQRAQHRLPAALRRRKE